ncbi:hypothetical protein D2T31_12190 [Sinirhodobacter populi]|uniref:Uncharacterized protein n=1 Tax=Paenirhodobacter populi TaxID=2306993 RepID=A0A443K7Y5_9RHOB|nr:hypothetical protein [Sinirhodobacter populi]RWR28865.1 hypothetical protein D2T31_12190 [Sinirhodobacter populi]
MTSPPTLISGPYHPPDISDGWLDDAADGLVEVGGWTSAPIPWPRRKKTGRHSPILCGDLILAVSIESSAAIQHYWGVSEGTVWRWRQALGIGRVTPGTRERLRTETGVPEVAAARGREIAASPESRCKMAASKRGKPIHPNTKVALSEAIKQPKPDGWGARANAWMRSVDHITPAPVSDPGLPDLPVYVTPHAIARFRERLRSIRADDDIAAQICAALKTPHSVKPGAHGHGWVVRSRSPHIRVFVEPSYDGTSLVAVTVLPG